MLAEMREGLSPFDGRLVTATPTEQWTCEHPCTRRSTGVIGFDIGRHFRRSGSRMPGYLVNDLGKPIGADSKRTDFALAA